MPNITNITPPRVPLTDPKTGFVTREWYRFFYNLFNLTGGGATDVTIEDLQLQPASMSAEVFAEINSIYNSALTQPRAELGTVSALQQDNVPWLRFNNGTAFSYTPPVGTIWWDGGTTLNIQNTANVSQPIGEAQYYYIKATSAISKGQLIMFDGAVGASGLLKGKPATGVTLGDYLMGIAAEDIANNAFGIVSSFGLVRGFNTSGSPYGETWADGDILYYNPSYPGGLTKTIPSAPNVKATVAAVVNAASGGSGSVFVRVSFGSKLGQTDSNVQFGTLSNDDLIQYDSTLQYWKNVAPSSVSIGTATNLAGGAAGSVPYQSASNTTTFLSIGTNNYVLTSNGSAPIWTANTGTGNVVRATSPSLVTPILGVPQSGDFSTGTFTWPTFNQNTTGTAAGLSATLVASSGGTGQSSYAIGDILYASAPNALSKLADAATGNALISGGVGVAPSYGKIGLTTHVSGTLPIANGGTNGTSFTTNYVTYFDGTKLTGDTNLYYNPSTVRLGIGTSSPGSTFHVYSTSNAFTLVQGTTNAAYNRYSNTGGQFYQGIDDSTASIFGAGNYSRVIYCSDAYPLVFFTNDTRAMTLDSNRYLLIGYNTSNGAYKLQVNSQIFATSSTIATSDARYKDQITPISDGLFMVNALNPVMFKWKKHPVHDFDTVNFTTGFLAHEVQTALAGKPFIDSLVKTNECELEDGSREEFLGIAEGNMIAILTAAVKELSTKVDRLEAQIAKSA